MAVKLRAKNNMVWGEVVNFYLSDGPEQIYFDKQGLSREEISPQLAEHIQKIDPKGENYSVDDGMVISQDGTGLVPREIPFKSNLLLDHQSTGENSDTSTLTERMDKEIQEMSEEQKPQEASWEEEIERSPDAEDDRSHGIDPVAKAAEEPSKHELHEARLSSGVDPEKHGTQAVEDSEDRKSGVEPEVKASTRNNIRGEGQGRHGIAEKNFDAVKVDEEENARSGVDTKKRDSSRKLTAEDNINHGISPDEPKSSARKILGDDPRDELRANQSAFLHEDPRRTLKEGKNDILYEDERDNLTSSPLDDPRAGDDPADGESRAKSRKKAK